MRRYLESLANLILTDYLEFRWYVAGEPRIVARLAQPTKKSTWHIDAQAAEQVNALLQSFLESQAPTVASPKELATRMAATARLIREAIEKAFRSEEGGGALHAQLEGFRQVLLPDLSPEQFADMYAQTLCYGLFAARCNVTAGMLFTRVQAAYDIPKTNPFLRRMFAHIAGPELDDRVAWAVDDLAETLNRADMTAILRNFGQRTRQEDPVVHFYETFLAAYDPKMREARGVYYTPEPVVSYIVRSVDHLLKTDFALRDGLADAARITITVRDADGKPQQKETHQVQILDPATGTGTFLHSIVDHIHDTFKGNQGMWSGYISQHLLPRLFGFELLMAPYAVAHMKLGLQLKETGYDFHSSERLGVYLTNTLEGGFEGGMLPFAEWLVEEAKAAGGVKYTAPVMVVIGNPPYSGHSANKGRWISDLLHGIDDLSEKKVGNYFEVDEEPLGERNPKYLNDDYVKFIRFAQWRIERTGYGILAFITNHGYLNNPTFRGMRQSLMQSFDEIYILDLHGNSKKRERAPSGIKDENVFDIQQGVAIGIFVRRASPHSSGQSRLATVRHAHLWGPREVYEKAGQEQQLIGGKYHWLANHDITTTEWTTLDPQSPFYLFTPQRIDLQTEYEVGWRVVDILPVNSTGVKTHRDHFAVDFDEASLRTRIRDFIDLSIPDDEIAEKYDLQDTGDWKLKARRRSLAADSHWRSYFTRCLYRPFDIRAYFHSEDVVDRSRQEIMHHMLTGKNIALATTRSVEIGRGWEHVLCSNTIIQHHTVSLKETNYLFPLYLYPNPHSVGRGLFDLDATEDGTAPATSRQPNLSATFIAAIMSKLNLRFLQDGRGDLLETFGPEDIFDYLYAIFHSPTYRTRYAEFLKANFPRLPLTSNVDLFRELSLLGARLVALHVMEQNGSALPSYPITGSNMVEKIEYRVPSSELEQGRIFINKVQYFDGVPSTVWEFYIGGYQVCHKWLKDRKGQVLTYEGIQRYRCLVATLMETISLMEQIDSVIEEYEGWPIG